jgi:hypothetical protein
VFTLQNILYASAVVVLAAGLFYSIRFARRHEKKEFDTEASRTMAKHPVLGNWSMIVILISFAVLSVFILMSIFYE